MMKIPVAACHDIDKLKTNLLFIIDYLGKVQKRTMKTKHALGLNVFEIKILSVAMEQRKKIRK